MEHSSQTGDLAWRMASSMLIISRWDWLKPQQGQEGECGIRNVKTGGGEGGGGGKGMKERAERSKGWQSTLKVCDSKIKAWMITGQRNRNLFTDVRAAESERCCSFTLTLLFPWQSMNLTCAPEHTAPSSPSSTTSLLMSIITPESNCSICVFVFCFLNATKSEKDDLVGPPVPVGSRLPIKNLSLT